MRNLICRAALFAALITLTFCSSSAQESSYIDIRPGELEKLLAERDVVIIDVRTPAEWAGGTVEGALTINLSDPSFEERVTALDPDADYLIYCNSGNRSRVASHFMSANGFRSVFNYDGMHTQIRREHQALK
ncbi:rhodanese-like domain-containing protein [Balneolales bacterium ANBcel1]|nr:rhodanese-like domain-containing protein [Balneolales bacterium ANBcel1]